MITGLLFSACIHASAASTGPVLRLEPSEQLDILRRLATITNNHEGEQRS
jgi:hypothetical protein